MSTTGSGSGRRATASSRARIDVIQNDGYIRSINQELRLADNSNPLFRWTVGGNYSHDFSDERDATDQRDGTSDYTDIVRGASPLPATRSGIARS